ncbi:MAG TPA: NAD(+)/NADH kinase [Verrucomicrobiota bacterium]|nr:NAD(+)/NADH kinase [Verrucomicrobiota bacterium]
MKRIPEKIKVVGIVANTSKPYCAQYIQEAANLLVAKGISLLAEVRTAQFFSLKVETVDNIRKLAKKCDILFVLGGDGTILRVARETAGVKIPIVGINLGKLGFLTTAPSEELESAITKIFEQKAFVETRPLILASGRPFGAAKKHLAVNDFVISRAGTSRMIDLEVIVNGVYLTRYRCDGLIVCSPTGSTAYSLSAGGAIVSPEANVFTITPICPHTLSNRSVIVSLNSVIKIKYLSEKVNAFISTDGQIENQLLDSDELIVQKSRHSLHLVHLEGDTFFNTLRHKLNWSGSNV